MLVNTIGSVLVSSPIADDGTTHLTTLTNGPMAQAQAQADMFMSVKKGEPMVFEWVDSLDASGKGIWKRITIYINPSNLNYQQQKIIGKQATRNGIFYNIWGDDNASITLQGTTGLSAMEGIKQLEDLFTTGGTLLAYAPNSIKTISGVIAPSYSPVDYTDPGSVVKAATGEMTPDMIAQHMAMMSVPANQMTLGGISPDMMTQDRAAQSVPNSQTNTTGPTYQAQINNGTNYAMGFINSYAGAVEKSQFMDNITSAINETVDYYARYGESNGVYPTTQQFRQFALSTFQNWLGDSTHSDVILALATDLTNDFYSNSNPLKLVVTEEANLLYQAAGGDSVMETMAQQQMDETNSSTVAAMMASETVDRLQSYIADFNVWVSKEADYRQKMNDRIQMFSYLDFENKWEPRKIIIYFEDRAYVGFFQNFSYQRTAKDNLITYQMQFVVQYQFKADNHVETPEETIKRINSYVYQNEQSLTPDQIAKLHAEKVAAGQLGGYSINNWGLVSQNGQLVSGLQPLDAYHEIQAINNYISQNYSSMTDAQRSSYHDEKVQAAQALGYTVDVSGYVRDSQGNLVPGLQPQ